MRGHNCIRNIREFGEVLRGGHIPQFGKSCSNVTCKYNPTRRKRKFGDKYSAWPPDFGGDGVRTNSHAFYNTLFFFQD